MSELAAKKRIEWIDIAKGVAIILIVLGHAPIGPKLYGYLYSFHVPLFFFVAGITFRFNVEESFFSFIKKKFLRLMVPYYAFGLIAISIFCLMNKIKGEALDMFGYNPTPLQMIKSLVYGSGENHALHFYQALWFLPCLFSVYLISYCICKKVSILRKFFKESVVLCCAVLFVVVTLCIRKFCASLSLPFGLVQAFAHIPFFLLAVVLRTSALMCTDKRLINMILAVFLVFAGAAISIGHYFCVAGFKQLTLHAVLLSYVVGVLSCLGYVNLCISVCNFKILSFVGQHTLSLLVLHKYPIVLGDVLFPQFRLNSGNLYYCIPLTAFAVVASLFVGLFIDRYFPFLYGKPFRRQTS